MHLNRFLIVGSLLLSVSVPSVQAESLRDQAASVGTWSLGAALPQGRIDFGLANTGSMVELFAASISHKRRCTSGDTPAGRVAKPVKQASGGNSRNRRMAAESRFSSSMLAIRIANS